MVLSVVIFVLLLLGGVELFQSIMARRNHDHDDLSKKFPEMSH